MVTMPRTASLNTRRASVRWNRIYYLCFPCGLKYGRKTPGAGATWHAGRCGLCRRDYIPVTGKRDYSIPLHGPRWNVRRERRADHLDPPELLTALRGYHMKAKTIKCRLEYLRQELRAERISFGELSELQSLAKHIDAGDVELLEVAGVPEMETASDSALDRLERQYPPDNQ